MKRYRASEASLAMDCPASVNGPENEMRIESSNPAALVGTVVHKIAEEIVHSGGVPMDWQDTAKAHGLDETQIAEVGSLVFAAKAFWAEYGHFFEDPSTEVSWVVGLRDDITISGHIDVQFIEETGSDSGLENDQA